MGMDIQILRLSLLNRHIQTMGEEVVQDHYMHALSYTHAKVYQHQIIVRYSTARYGTEELPGPALLLPDTVARNRKRESKEYNKLFELFIQKISVKILVSSYCKHV